MTKAPPRAKLPPALKLAIDFGPLLVFFAANKFGGVFTATAAFMVATLVAMAVSWWKTRHIPAMLIFTGIIVLVFGGLTLWLQDETFIKLKPTLIYGMFAAILLFGLKTQPAVSEGRAGPGAADADRGRLAQADSATGRCSSSR